MFGNIKHLPAVMLIASLITSVILCTITNRRIARVLYIIFALFVLCSSLLTLFYLKKDFIYCFGGWNKGIGIDIAVNNTSAFFLAITSVVFFITSYGITTCKNIKTSLFGFCGLVFTGLCGLILTVDWFNFYVFLELTSISLYVLLTSDYGDGKSYSSAFNYLITGSVANIFILLGIFFIYFTTGTLNMAVTSKMISNNQIASNNYILIQAAYILITIGLITKAALYPLHSWIMNCYINIPSALTAFISAIVTKIAMFNIYKINNVFGYIFVSIELRYFVNIVIILCYLAIIVCSIGALLDKNLKTIFAFSSMSQSGYMLLGIFSFNHSVGVGVLLQMLAHSLSIAALFMIIEAIEKRFDYKINIDLNSLKNRCLQGEKFLKFTFLMALFSIVGFPLTLGFIAKWCILSGFYLSLQYLSFGVIIIGGAIGMLYSWRIVEYLFFYDDSLINKPSTDIIITAHTTKILIFLVGLVIILLGIFNEKVFKIIVLAT